MAALKVLLRDKSSAEWEADEIRTLEPQFAAKRWLENYPMTDSEQRTKMMHALSQLSL
jgi:hypothetical protein